MSTGCRGHKPVSKDDAWAFGTTNHVKAVQPNGGARDDTDLVLHWDGSRWSQTSDPQVAPLIGGISIAHDDSAFMYGPCTNNPRGSLATYIARWDGHAWQAALAPKSTTLVPKTSRRYDANATECMQRWQWQPAK